MYKGITPTIILTLPESSAVLNASHVYVTIADKCKSITKQDDELTIEADTEHEAINISVFLTQSETLARLGNMACTGIPFPMRALSRSVDGTIPTIR